MLIYTGGRYILVLKKKTKTKPKNILLLSNRRSYVNLYSHNCMYAYNLATLVAFKI